VRLALVLLPWLAGLSPMRRAVEYAAQLPACLLVPLCLRSGVRLSGLRKSEHQRRHLSF